MKKAVPTSVARAAALAPYRAAFYTFLFARRTYAALRPEHAWRTWVSQEILVGGFLVPSDIVELKRQGITAIVNLTHELVEPLAAIEAAAMDYVHVPCWDGRYPACADADRAIEFIAAQVTQGKRVYVHCASGAGRSVALVICYFALHEGLTPREAFKRIKALRPRASLSRAQWEFVSTYLDAHRPDEPRPPEH